MTTQIDIENYLHKKFRRNLRYAALASIDIDKNEEPKPAVGKRGPGRKRRLSKPQENPNAKKKPRGPNKTAAVGKKKELVAPNGSVIDLTNEPAVDFKSVASLSSNAYRTRSTTSAITSRSSRSTSQKPSAYDFKANIPESEGSFTHIISLIKQSLNPFNIIMIDD